MSPGWTLGKIWAAQLPEASLERILRTNALTLLPKIAAQVK
jgi:hypothetical protein